MSKVERFRVSRIKTIQIAESNPRLGIELTSGKQSSCEAKEREKEKILTLRFMWGHVNCTFQVPLYPLSQTANEHRNPCTSIDGDRESRP